MRFTITLLTATLLLVHSILIGFNDEPVCFKEIPTTFFQYEAVAQALSLHHVDPGQWDPIYHKLLERSKDVSGAVRGRVANEINSPLEYPFNGKEAMKVMYQVLYEVFTGALRESNITNESDLKGMFAYIRRKQAEKINTCLESAGNNRFRK